MSQHGRASPSPTRPSAAAHMTTPPQAVESTELGAVPADGDAAVTPSRLGSGRVRCLLAAAGTVLALTYPLLVSTPALADRYEPGSTSGGDPYFPTAGNGGYDVQHYDLTLSYDPATGRLDGTAVATLTATADLDSFSLDLRGLTATSVTVDGGEASYEQQPPDATTGRGGELVIRQIGRASCRERV